MVRTRNYHIYRNAQKKDILKSYRKLAMQWHPDKFESEDEKKEAEKKFMDIAAAKEVLSDPGMYTFTIHLSIYIVSCDWIGIAFVVQFSEIPIDIRVNEHLPIYDG